MDYHRLLAEEGSSLTDEKIDLRRRQSKWRSPSNIALLVLSATTLISTLALLRIAMFATPASCPVEEHFTSSYGKHEDRMSLDHKFDYAWEEALTPAWGVIMIDQEGNGEETKAGISMYALPKNLALFERAALRYFPSAEHPDLTSMSRMHQLHCLASFHRALQEQHDGKDIGLDQNDDIHWPHCFDYLYETLLCHADDTLETAPHGGLINGESTPRTCRNSDKLFKLYAEKPMKVQRAREHGH